MRQTQHNFLRLHSRLRAGLSELDEDRFDYVLIDCPPNFNIVTKTAIVCSDHILIPAVPDYLSTLGIDQLSRHVRQLTDDFNGYATQAGGDWDQMNPEVLGIIPTMIRVYGGQPIATQRQFLRQLEGTGLPIFDTFVRRNDSRYGDSPLYGVPIVLLSSSNSTYEAVREELEGITTEFLQKIT